MAKGLYLTRDGQVLVDYGKRRVTMSAAQYRANGYKPPCDKLPAEAQPMARKEHAASLKPTSALPTYMSALSSHRDLSLSDTQNPKAATPLTR